MQSSRKVLKESACRISAGKLFQRTAPDRMTKNVFHKICMRQRNSEFIHCVTKRVVRNIITINKFISTTLAKALRSKTVKRLIHHNSPISRAMHLDTGARLLRGLHLAWDFASRLCLCHLRSY